MIDLAIPIDSGSNVPIYEQIYEYIKNEIREGKLEVGSRLSSTRIMSKNLMVSRSTVQLAYDQLLSEGYIESVPCKGYYVLKIDGLYNIQTKPWLQSDIKAKDFNSRGEKQVVEYDFSPYGVELNNFPYNTWRKISKNVLSMEEMELFSTGDARGDYEFRKTISKYLHEARGVNCTPENIIIGAGMEYLLLLLDQLLIRASGRENIYAMENPTYIKAYSILKGAGRQVIPVTLDEYGMKPQDLYESNADIAYVTPSHQYPLGIVMSIGRRTELLKWAGEKEGRYIIEDDYDSEFRYKGKPIPSLQGIDNIGRVIYKGTFSKSIAPGIRIGYMVLPDSLMQVYQEVGRNFSNTVSRIDQNVVNTFITEGYYERHLNKMRSLYKVKHDCLLSNLKKLGSGFTVAGESAGLHILLSTDRFTEEELVESAKKKGVRVYPLSSYYIDKSRVDTKQKFNKATVIIGYAKLNEKDIEKGVEILVSVWGNNTTFSK